MTGPRSTTVQPHRTRARPLLPFLAAIAVACSEHPTMPQLPGTDAPASVRLHPYPPKVTAGASGTSFLRVGQSAQLVSLGTETGSSSRVLLLSDFDFDATTGLANSIANAGFLVTVRPAPENTWDGTNPSLDGFDLVIHLNGNTVGEAYVLSPAAQDTLVNFVRTGGGFIGAQWSGYEAIIGQGRMQDLVLMGYDGPEADNCFMCRMTYTRVDELQNHPVLAGIPSEFSFYADGHLSGGLTVFESDPSIVLMKVSSGFPGVVVRSLDAGRVVNFSFAPNYFAGGDPEILLNPTLLDPNIQQLYVNAVRWAARAATQPTKAPATITLGYAVATFDGTPKSVSVATSPAGLTGVSVTYSQDGVVVPAPVNAGTYQVLATLTHEDYEAPQASGTLTIHRAVPTIHWASPVTILVGTALGSDQLNASVTGIDGIAPAGELVYLPAAGTIMNLAGSKPLSVEFVSWDDNYTNVIGQVFILVSQPTSSLIFRGFYLPVRNMPVQNTVMPGRALPVKFSVTGNQRESALAGNPTSIEVPCVPGVPEQPVKETVDFRGSRLEMNRGTGEYRYYWKTSASWVGTCRKLVVKLVDGSTHEALFRFPRQSSASGVGRRDDNQASAPKKKEQEKQPKQEKPKKAVKSLR
jgi:hypothetical protein